MIFSRTLLISLAAAALLLATGCSRETPLSTSSARQWMEPVRTINGITGRSVVLCPAGPCVLLHYPPDQFDENSVARFLHRHSGPAADEVVLCVDPSDRWCQSIAEHGVTNTFNCCTYAVGHVVPLTTIDWIAPAPSGETAYTFPMQVLLDSYFDRVASFPCPVVDWDHIATDTNLKANDVVCFVNTRERVPYYIHAGRIVKQDGKNWVASKLGSGPIVRTTFSALAEQYGARSDKIWVFRAKPSTRKRGLLRRFT